MLRIASPNLETLSLTTLGNQQPTKQKMGILGVTTVITHVTQDTCWEIHDKLTNWKLAHERKSWSNIASMEETTTASEPNPFSKEQMGLLKKMFSFF